MEEEEEEEESESDCDDEEEDDEDEDESDGEIDEEVVVQSAQECSSQKEVDELLNKISK
jgi:hypothetical protein